MPQNHLNKRNGTGQRGYGDDLGSDFGVVLVEGEKDLGEGTSTEQVRSDLVVSDSLYCFTLHLN